MLWDCVPVLDDATRQRVEELGGIAAICMSHPHFYAANVDLADAFDATIHIPRADQQWVRRGSSRIELFDDEVEPVPGVTMARIGGHFDGAAVLHWPGGSEGRGALLTGDTIMVVQDREWVSFMWSYPNLIPLDEATVLRHRGPGRARSTSTASTAAGGARSWWRTAPRRSAAPPRGTSPGSGASARRRGGAARR